ncbi:facilitated trehalose transporter Tret1-like isoform X2 [Venturia canescens]|uniref:facilitated trehalose transporter Tret1-like isoform X2 n=1 Tax=Venturia canescens TaxID=32260 RepID=UPI001C9C58BC|nr:facilitated trehalose transporter Tret1-like isoform X2 [Venturia canescens]
MATTMDALLEKPEEASNVEDFEMERNRNRTQWKQWLASISATLSMIAAGTVYGWTTTILSRLLKGQDVPMRITSDESSWIVSLTVIGSMVGPFLGAWLATRHGRKFSLMFSSIFYIVGWVIVLVAGSVGALYASRVVLGIGVGMSYTTNPMYVSEVADTNIRGALGTLIAVNVFTGSLLACSVGPWVSYTALGLVMLSVPIIFLSTFAWFPESPYYLASKGLNEEATKALIFFKGIKEPGEAKRELENVLKNVDENREDSKDRGLKLRRLLSSNNRRAFFIVFGLIVAQQLSGSFSTMQYLETLFSKTNIGIDSNIATIIVLAVGLVSGALSTGLVEGAGRRPLLIVSTLGSGLTLGVLAVYLLLDFQNVQLSAINILPVIDVILFQVAYQVGLGTLPNALIGELFPTSAKHVAGAAITISDGILGFAVSKLYQVIGDLVGNLHIVYFVFSASCFAAFLFVFLFVPETKNKSFADIRNELSSEKFRCREQRRRSGVHVA